MSLTSIELCAGADGQALGLESAGFEPLALVEIDKHACATLRHNRPHWPVHEADLLTWQPPSHLPNELDLIAGGVPCPPFSHAGKQLGPDDDRNLFPRALELVAQLAPKAVLLENVRGLLDPCFVEYRDSINQQLSSWGYHVGWRLLAASDFGVSQLRPRTVLVALQRPYAQAFEWPEVDGAAPLTVGELLGDLMAEAGWEGAEEWARDADSIAPTLVGGSRKHGGPDLGPTRARQAWAKLGVEGRTIADEPPAPGFVGMPRLTVRMAARVQGFPDSWHIVGRKTAAYRQVGNAFPPPVAAAVAQSVAFALHAPVLHKQRNPTRAVS